MLISTKFNKLMSEYARDASADERCCWLLRLVEVLVCMTRMTSFQLLLPAVVRVELGRHGLEWIWTFFGFYLVPVSLFNYFNIISVIW